MRCVFKTRRALFREQVDAEVDAKAESEAEPEAESEAAAHCVATERRRQLPGAVVVRSKSPVDNAHAAAAQ